MFLWISRLPLRKPLVVLATIIFLGMLARSVILDIDIPPNTTSVCNTFIAVVLAGYFGSSAYEAVCQSNRERGDADDSVHTNANEEKDAV